MASLQSNFCRLCVNVCENDDFKRLYEENGRRTELYNIIHQYFHPKFLDMQQWQHLKSICLQCWRQVCDFHSFQTSVMMAQFKLMDEDKDKEFEVKSEIVDGMPPEVSPYIGEPYIKDEPLDDALNTDMVMTQTFVPPQKYITPTTGEKQNIKSPKNSINEMKSDMALTEPFMCSSNVAPSVSQGFGNFPTSESKNEGLEEIMDIDEILHTILFQMSNNSELPESRPMNDLNYFRKIEDSKNFNSLQLDKDVTLENVHSSEVDSVVAQDDGNVSSRLCENETKTEVSSQYSTQSVSNNASIKSSPADDSPLLNNSPWPNIENSKNFFNSMQSHKYIIEKDDQSSKFDSTEPQGGLNVSSSTYDNEDYQNPQESESKDKDITFEDNNTAASNSKYTNDSSIDELPNIGNSINVNNSMESDILVANTEPLDDLNVSSSTCGNERSLQDTQKSSEPLGYVTETDLDDNQSENASNLPTPIEDSENEQKPSTFRNSHKPSPWLSHTNLMKIWKNYSSLPHDNDNMSSSSCDEDDHPSAHLNDYCITAVVEKTTSPLNVCSSKKSLKSLNALVLKWKPILNCQLCPGWWCSRYSLLEQHFRQQHPTDKCYITCCDRMFSSRYAIKAHIVQHINPNSLKEWKCDKCHKTFFTKRGLKFHFNAHIKSEPQETEEIDLVNGQPVYKCNECGRNFTRKMSLIQHRWYKHSTNRKHKCKICGQAFMIFQELREHSAIHTGKDVYACLFCPATFNRYFSIYRHRKKVHPHKGATEYYKILM